MARAGVVYVDVRADTGQFTRDMQRATADASRSLGSITATGAKQVFGDMAKAAGVATLAIAGVGAAATKVTLDFDKAVSGVAAVAGASAQELGALREAALTAGADTAFSASEAAKAEAELAKAGVAVSDILGGALRGSLDLAAAGQLDLGKSAEIAAQAMNIFGIGGNEVSRIADVLAAGANKSAADVGQLGDALRQGGLVSAQLGIGLEDTVGALSLFADNALVGSDAGTSFKTTLQRLTPTSKEQAKAMDELGLSFFDAEGNFVGIAETAQRLQESLGGLTQEQRSAALTTIFGSDAVRAASLLYDAGADGVNEYTEAVSEQGAAAKVAATQLDNLAGDVEEFSGSVETSLIRIGDLLTPTLRGIVAGGTELVNVFNAFAVTPAWRAIEQNITRTLEPAIGRIDGLADGLDGLLAGIDPSDVNAFFDRLNDGIASARQAFAGLEPVIAGLGISFASMAASSIPFVGALVPALSPITGLLGGIVVGSQDARDAVGGFAGRLADLARSVGPDVLSALADFVDMLGSGVAVVLDGVGGAAIDVADTLGPVLADAIREVSPVIGDLIEAGSDLASSVLPLIASAVEDVAPLVVDVLAGGLGLAATAMELVSDNSVLLAAALGGLVAIKFGDTIARWGSALGGIATSLSTGASDFKTYFGVLRAEGASVGGAFKGAAKETGGLTGGLLGLNPAVVGVTAAVTLGTLAYKSYADRKAEVAELADDLVEAVQKEQAAFEDAEEALRRKAFQDKDSLDIANELGLSLSDLSEIAAGNAAAFQDAAFYVGSANVSVEAFRLNMSEAPEEVQQVTDAIADLVENDKLDIGQARAFFAAMQDLANGTADGIREARNEFESIALEAKDRGDITATQFEELSKRIRNASSPQEVQDAFEDLFGYLSGVGDSASKAADEVRSLIDALAELGLVQRNVDELERGLLDSRQRTLEAFADGAGIDRNTPEGRARLDALQREIEATERYAEELAKLDSTGQRSALVLNAQRQQLEDLASQGKLSADELAYLIDTYGLMPENIETTVAVNISDAEASLDEITTRLKNIPGGPDVDPVKAEIETLIDEGKWAEAIRRLVLLEREIKPVVRVKVDEEEARKAGLRVAALVAAGSLTRGQGADSLRYTSQALTYGGARAGGGLVDPSAAYLVGEKGRELFVPDTSGIVIPNNVSEAVIGAPQANPSDRWFSAMVQAMDSQTAAIVQAVSASGTQLNISQRNYGYDRDDVGARTMDAGKALVASL